MANEFISPQTPQANVVVTTTANTTYTNAPTNTQVLATMGSSGGRVTRIRSTPRATVAATGLHLFLSTDGGTTKVLIDSVLVAAHTVAAATEIPSTDWGYSDDNPLILKAGAILYVSQAVSLTDGIAHAIEWGDY